MFKFAPNAWFCVEMYALSGSKQGQRAGMFGQAGQIDVTPPPLINELTQTKLPLCTNDQYAKQWWLTQYS